MDFKSNVVVLISSTSFGDNRASITQLVLKIIHHFNWGSSSWCENNEVTCNLNYDTTTAIVNRYFWIDFQVSAHTLYASTSKILSLLKTPKEFITLQPDPTSTFSRRDLTLPIFPNIETPDTSRSEIYKDYYVANTYTTFWKHRFIWTSDWNCLPSQNGSIGTVFRPEYLSLY